MIYGPYSTGWRDEKSRRERLARRAAAVLYAWLGVVLVVGGGAYFWACVL